MSSHRGIESSEDWNTSHFFWPSTDISKGFLDSHLLSLFSIRGRRKPGKSLFGWDMPFRSVEPSSGTRMGKVTENDN